MKSGAAFLLAVLLAIVLAYGSFGSGSSSDGDSDHSDSASSSKDHDSGQDKPDKDDSGKDSDKKKSDKEDRDKDDKDSGGDSSYAEAMKQRLENDGLHVQRSAADSAEDCAAHSYGEVRTWFQNHPCTRVDRAWYEVRDDQDNKAVLSVAWVEMPDADSAGELQTLVDRPGTGNATELSKDEGPYQGTSYSGWYYRSSRDGDTFSSVQAEPVAHSDGSREVARRAAGVADAA
jgi:hypothetical protein